MSIAFLKTKKGRKVYQFEGEVSSAAEALTRNMHWYTVSKYVFLLLAPSKMADIDSNNFTIKVGSFGKRINQGILNQFHIQDVRRRPPSKLY